jgi:SAM-dependent methyltransferase
MGGEKLMLAPRTVEKTLTSTKQQIKSAGSEKRRDQFLAVLRRHLKTCHVDPNEKVLVVGGSWQDAEVLHSAGFQDITLSSFRAELEGDRPAGLCLKVRRLTLDAERIELEDGSFDCVVAHEVLHHCRSPHKALCEMLRVAGKHILLLEPNDSLSMRVLTWAGFSFPYEIFSVVYHEGMAGGVRDTGIPNFIYRWNANEVRKTVSSYLAEYTFSVHAHPHWDFNVNAEHLSLRRETRIDAITSVIGSNALLILLRAAQIVFNAIPILRQQGNKFFCCIEKMEKLQPWLTAGNGKIKLRSGFQPEAG